jgi:hypothetical protein
MALKPTRVFLSLQPVGYKKPAGADPFTYQDKRPSRWRASWWMRGTPIELYRGKPVATKEEAVRLARRWLEQQRKETASHAVWDLVDTTDQPERYGYAHEPAEKKTTAQLDAEIAETLARGKP